MRYLTTSTLLLALTPAHALSIDACDQAQEFIEAAMDLRLAGEPAQNLLRELEAGGVPHLAPLVTAVYELDRSTLTGAQRADFLTAFYARCLAMGADS